MLNVKKLYPVHNFSSNTYVISSDGEYAVVDPSVPYSEDLCPGVLKYVLLTHSHFDHILDIDSTKMGLEEPYSLH
jgi:glyoxylase-like metal-dependent hydrolase (beta-lactamase superfamily II)